MRTGFKACNWVPHRDPGQLKAPGAHPSLGNIYLGGFTGRHGPVVCVCGGGNSRCWSPSFKWKMQTQKIYGEFKNQSLMIQLDQKLKLDWASFWQCVYVWVCTHERTHTKLNWAISISLFVGGILSVKEDLSADQPGNLALEVSPWLSSCLLICLTKHKMEAVPS